MAAALLAAPIGRLVAGDGAAPAVVRPGPAPMSGGAQQALPPARAPETNRASTEPRNLPVFARPRPDLVIENLPAIAPSSVPADLAAALATPPTARRPVDLRALERSLDPGLNTRALTRPGEVPLPEKEAEELRQRMRPGFTAPAPYKVPFVHTDVIAPHLTPDVEVAVSDRTKLGVFGQVRPAGDGKSVPFPGIVNRPLGAGVTFEYRFGTK